MEVEEEEKDLSSKSEVVCFNCKTLSLLVQTCCICFKDYCFDCLKKYLKFKEAEPRSDWFCSACKYKYAPIKKPKTKRFVAKVKFSNPKLNQYFCRYHNLKMYDSTWKFTKDIYCNEEIKSLFKTSPYKFKVPEDVLSPFLSRKEKQTIEIVEENIEINSTNLKNEKIIKKMVIPVPSFRIISESDEEDQDCNSSSSGEETSDLFYEKLHSNYETLLLPSQIKKRQKRKPLIARKLKYTSPSPKQNESPSGKDLLKLIKTFNS